MYQRYFSIISTSCLSFSVLSARMELSGDVILASDLYTNSWIKFVKKLQVCVGLSRRDSF